MSTERREVASRDPSLSPESNRRLTREVREIVGDDVVAVDADTPSVARSPHGTRSTAAATVADHRAGLLMVVFVLLMVGVVVSVTTGAWWVLVAAVIVGVACALGMVLTALRLTTDLEHPSPSLAARLQEEGVADPDRLMTDLVESFTPPDQPGDDEDRTTSPTEDHTQATAEQRRATTPSHGPSQATGPGDGD